MEIKEDEKLNDGDKCMVIAGTHVGKSGIVRDIHTSKTGHITITVEQKTEFDSRHLARMWLFRQVTKHKIKN